VSGLRCRGRYGDLATGRDPDRSPGRRLDRAGTRSARRAIRNGKRAEVGEHGAVGRGVARRFLADPRDDGLFALVENDVSGIR
jgi:hypothetical protein